MPAKTITYNSVAERFIAERDLRELMLILVKMMERTSPGLFEQVVNEDFAQPNGEPHTASYTKPQ